MNNLFRWTLVCVLSVFSPTLFALGLGGAEVRSYLDQPLDVRVELISRSSDELESITAGLASAKDFELLGMNRAAISVPLTFEMVTDSPEPYIRITSDLKVSEPVVQVLVEVVWASGRMLREYTLFLDPPTFESVAPPVEVSPQLEALPAREIEPSPAKVQRSDEPGQSSEVSRPTDSREAAASVEDAVTEPATEPATETSSATGDLDDDEQVYGPVASGETLWGIARDFSRGSGYSVNQAMLALQRKNPEAFIRNNINNLKRGAILRLPTMQEMGELSGREAMLEALRQEEEARTGIPAVAPDYSTPTVADTGDYQDTGAEQVEPVIAGEDEGHLELVPPAEEEVGADSALDQQDNAVADAGADAIRDQLSRTEEELVNAQQENTYLTERIKELESQLEAQAQVQEEVPPEQTLGVEDSGLARLETELEEQRLEDQPEAPVAITPGGESQPWYAGINLLLIGAGLLFIVVLVWALWRRNEKRREEMANGPVAALAVEAEQILKTLRDDDEKTVVQPKPEPEPEPESKPEPDLEPEPAAIPEPVVPDLPPQADADTIEEVTMQMASLENADTDTTEKMEAVSGEPSTEDEEDGETVVQKLPVTDPGFVIDFADEPVDDEPVDDATEEPVEEEHGDVSAGSDDNPEVKLDLARAYLSLGDKEASKSMLEEVLKTGNEEQVAEAKQMMDEL